MDSVFKLLMATDLSPSAVKAEQYAMLLALEAGADIRFVHVSEETALPPKQKSGTEAPYQLPEGLEKLADHIEALTESLGLEDPETLKLSMMFREDMNLQKAVLNEALLFEADLILTGTHKVSTLAEFFNGNDSWDIIKHAGIPVLAIPENASFAGITKIVYATALNEAEIPALHFVNYIARLFNAELMVLYISSFQLEKEIEIRLFDNFEKKLRYELHDDRVSMQMLHENKIINGLNDFCLQENASWLVMMHQRLSALERFFSGGSMSRSMSSHTKVPLLVLPDFYQQLH